MQQKLQHFILLFFSSIVSEEVELAEKGMQWPLSCYGPFKERPSIPGTEDVSPEEIRWEMYEAQKTGNVEQVVMLSSYFLLLRNFDSLIQNL